MGLPVGIEICCHNLEIAYDAFVALRSEQLHLCGTIISVIGHNGAGKSTFIKGILGLLKPTAGELTVTSNEGEQRTQLIPSRHMAFCPEVGAVFSDITVEQYIALWCRLKHHDARYYRGAGSRYLEALAVAPLLKKRGRELSKGQRRRVQTAIGFLLQPKLFLFDEPFDGLDVQQTSALAELIQSEAAQRSFIISSHRMDVVERLSDGLIVLKKGAVFSSGSVAEVSAALSGRTFSFSGFADPAAALQRLRIIYPECLVNRIGQNIIVAGLPPGPECFEVSAASDEPFLVGARIEEVPPSLVDGMTLHLRS